MIEYLFLVLLLIFGDIVKAISYQEGIVVAPNIWLGMMRKSRSVKDCSPDCFLACATTINVTYLSCFISKVFLRFVIPLSTSAIGWFALSISLSSNKSLRGSKITSPISFSSMKLYSSLSPTLCFFPWLSYFHVSSLKAPPCKNISYQDYHVLILSSVDALSVCYSRSE